jgi:4-hydroxy-tetrahydrodipicolinate reductase
MTRIGILGAGGRMGRALIAAVADTPLARLSGATDRAGSEAIGRDLGVLIGREPVGVAVTADPVALFSVSDVVIDFTAPAASAHHAALAADHGIALVVGTTGLNGDHQQAIDHAAGRVAVVQAANFSLGVNLLLALTRKVAATLDADFDIEILEMHHRHKVDAPSGTALALGRAAADGRGVDLDAVSDRVRDGFTGARQTGHIGFATLRGGYVIGDHSVIFAANGERLELGHRASDRTVFSRGAVRAALWAAGQPAGHYSMVDVLGL